MKTLVILLAALSTMVSAYDAKPTVDNLTVFSAKDSNEKIATVSMYQQVNVLSTSGMYSKIAFNGQKGWVETKYLQKIAQSGGNNIVMGAEDILNDLGDISDIYIMEDNTSLSKGLRVERSFADEMKSNEDKETLERKYTEYVKF